MAQSRPEAGKNAPHEGTCLLLGYRPDLFGEYLRHDAVGKLDQDGRAQAAVGPWHGDLIRKLPDDILGRILSLVGYKYAVRASATCRRWKDMHLQAPHVWLYTVSRGAGATQSMERMLRRRRRVQRLRVVYRADVPAQRECMARLIELADAPALEVCAQCTDKRLPEGGAGGA
uniref:F-box domain-containing protein n=1 Tax=Setaria italica TaxID=4555 RepID=K3ZFB1_SETIT